MPRKSKTSVDEKTLNQLKQQGLASDMADLRLKYMATSSILKYLKPLVGQSRIHPHVLPTQKSLRWSTKNPPLANFSANCINPSCVHRDRKHRNRLPECWSLRDIVTPDPGHYFLKWDLDAIEAKLAAAYSHDTEDLEFFRQGYDIHTKTCCDALGLPLPQDMRDPHTSLVDQAWREYLHWGGKEDWRRGACKAGRYAATYGTDEKAILQAKDVDMLGLTREELLAISRKLLALKPQLVAFKKRVWDHIMATHEVRHPLGGRKRLFISPEEYSLYRRSGRATPSCREGLNHLFQGWVAVAMNLMIIETKRRFPYMVFGINTHDGALWSVPQDKKPYPDIKEVVEQEWDIWGETITSTATWSAVGPEGKKWTL